MKKRKKIRNAVGQALDSCQKFDSDVFFSESESDSGADALIKEGKIENLTEIERN